MFKIVQTIEKGANQLTIVPSAWENKGFLSWPKQKAYKLVREAESTPAEDWFVMTCKLKRSCIISYSLAEEVLNKMLDSEESTEQEETIDLPAKRKRVQTITSKYIDHDFNSVAEKYCLALGDIPERPSSNDVFSSNSLAELRKPYREEPFIVFSQTSDRQEDDQLLRSDEPISERVKNTETLFSKSNISVDNAYSLLQPRMIVEKKRENLLKNRPPIAQRKESTIPEAGPINNDYSLLASTVETILTNQTAMMTNQTEMMTNQTAMMRKLSKLECLFDKMVEKASTCSCKTEKNETMDFKIINDLKSLEEVEKNLSEKNEIENYIKKLSHICGAKSKGHGLNSCYVLIDAFFSRQFLTECSWAGGSRNGLPKIPLKNFQKTISLFFRLVHLSDEDFTITECENFFKNVLRNSTRRNESDMSRCSKIKRRPKKLDHKLGNSYLIESALEEGRIAQSSPPATPGEDKSEVLLDENLEILFSD